MNFSRLTSAAMLCASALLAQLQPESLPTYFTPQVLPVGAASADLRVFRQDFRAGLVLRWNGSPRPTRSDPDGSGSLRMSLTADDLARPSLAEISVYDPVAEAAFGQPTYIAVGYPVGTAGTAYDTTRKLLFVATSSDNTDPRFPPNSVLTINPETGAIGAPADQGAPIRAIALSDDGSALYVALGGPGTIRKLDPDRLTKTAEFSFRAASPDVASGYSAVAIAVMPGKPDTIALYYHPQPGYSTNRLAVFDSGIQRAKQFNPLYEYDSVLFAPEGRALFLGSFQYSAFQGLLRLNVDESGIPDQAAVTALSGAPLEIHDGVLFTSGGTMLRADTMEPAGSLTKAGPLTVDIARGRILQLASYGTYSYSQDYLQAFDLCTQTPFGAQRINSSNYIDADRDVGRRVYRFGSDGVVFATSSHVLVFKTPLAGPAPAISAPGIINAASSTGGPIAPGEILSLYGDALGPDPLAVFTVEDGRIAPALANTQVWFDNKPGTVIMTYSGQINVIAPFGLKPGSTVRVQVWRFGIPSNQVSMTVAESAPGLFTRNATGRGLVSVVNQDFTINTPAPPGSIAALYGTGAGMVTGAADGQIAVGARPLAAASVRAYVGAVESKVHYAGAAPTLPHGVFQVNVEIPQSLAAGTYPIVIEIDGRRSPEGATIEVR